MLPEFEAPCGHAGGRDEDLPLTFPADYHGKEVARTLAQFDAGREAGRRAAMPPLDESFAQRVRHRVGQAGGPAQRGRGQPQARAQAQGRVDLKDQALKGLRGLADFALPRALIERKAQGLMQRMAATCASRA
jgi:trigger factor